MFGTKYLWNRDGYQPDEFELAEMEDRLMDRKTSEKDKELIRRVLQKVSNGKVIHDELEAVV